MRYLTLLIVSFLCLNCEYFKEDIPKVPIARVGNVYLFQEDVEALLNGISTPEDSTQIVSSYITSWATKQLLMEKAKVNIPKASQDAFEKLVEAYQTDLYTEAYKNLLVSQQLDTLILQEEIDTFYVQNQANFRLSSALYKLRYIQLSASFTDLPKVIERFKRFSEDDQEILSFNSIKYDSYNLNDSVWIQEERLFQELPILMRNATQVLKKSKFTQLQDSLGLYLVKIEDIKQPNEISPLSSITPTIKQIIINQRRFQLLRKIEKDILTDAIKKQSFEIFLPQ